jgi:peptidoglycan/LPS O-acetylase OafA/YrhL
VDLFFVLSGFLITGILLDAKGRRGYFRVFMARRVLRIFPLYYAVLTLAYLHGWLFNPEAVALLKGADSPLWFWCYVSNWGMVAKGWGLEEGVWIHTPPGWSMGHFWSLAVEEQFYLVWPLVVALLSRRRLMWLCVSFFVLAPAMSGLISEWAGNHLAGYVSTLGRLNTLGTGALLAIALRTPGCWEWLARRAGWWFAVSGLAGAAVLAFEWNIWFWKYDLLCVLVPLCFGSGLVCAVRGGGGWWLRFMRSGPMVFFGKYSYGLYIYHHLLRDLWVTELWEKRIVPLLGSGVAGTAAYVVAAGAASVALALLSWKVLEHPCLRLKRYFTYQRHPRY